MLANDQIIELIRHASRGDADALRVSAATLTVALSDSDPDFARAMGEALEQGAQTRDASGETRQAPSAGDLPIGLHPLKPKKTLAELRLPPEVAILIEEFLLEQRERDALSAAGLTPRHKCLLMGPPGNGKTVLAMAISVALGVPAYMVRYDDLISNKPGETSRNLLALFTYAAGRDCLIFLDEFDAIGRERDDSQESGEMKRVVSTLLVQLDDVPSHVVCMAATNHPGMLDAAIWRRFNFRIELPMPHLSHFAPFMRERLKHRNIVLDEEAIDLDTIAHRLMFENFSDCELWVDNVLRTMVLGKMTPEQSVQDQMGKWASGQKKLVG